MDDQAHTTGNRALYRDINQHIEHATPPLTRADEMIEVVCECGSIDCTGLIQLPFGDFEDLRQDEALSILKPGHEIGEIETVVDRHSAYNVVRRFDATRDVRATRTRGGVR